MSGWVVDLPAMEEAMQELSTATTITQTAYANLLANLTVLDGWEGPAKEACDVVRLAWQNGLHDIEKQFNAATEALTHIHGTYHGSEQSNYRLWHR